LVGAERLDRLDGDPTAIDGEALRGKCLFDVASRDGAVEAIAFADRLVDRDFDAGELL